MNICSSCDGESAPQNTSETSTSEVMTPEEIDTARGDAARGDTDELAPRGGIGTEELEGGGGDAPSSDSVTFDIPMIPKEEGTIKFLLVPNEVRQDSPNSQTYVVSYSLGMAFAEGYPTRYKVTLESPLFASTCAQSEGFIELQSISGDTVDVTLLDESSFLIEGIMPSVGTINAVGRFRPSASDLERCGDLISPMVEVRLEMRFDIAARVPRTLDRAQPLGACQETSDTLLLPMSSLQHLLPLGILDEDGTPVAITNAEHTHSVAFTATAPAGATLESPELGISGVKLSSNPGPLTIQAPFGAPLEYTVIDPQEVTAWSIAWSIAGLAGGGIAALEDSMIYDGPWGRTTNHILPVLTGHLASGDTLLCTPQVDPNFFTVTSETPENCHVDDLAYESSEVGGQTIGHSVTVTADGECRLRLNAPDFNGAQGLESSISVTLNQVDQMIGL